MGTRRRPDPEPPSEEAAWGRLLAWLAAGPRTDSEVARRLARWRVDPEAAARLRRRLRDAGLIDDRAFAEAYAAELVRSGHRGRSLSQRLAARGVDRDLAREASGATEPDDPDADAVELARRRLARLPSDPATAARRLIAYLVRRGVPHDRARRAAAVALDADADADT